MDGWWGHSDATPAIDAVDNIALVCQECLCGRHGSGCDLFIHEVFGLAACHCPRCHPEE
jgi:hypothetical protein